MSNARAIHEGCMNPARSILPRVGGGVGEGVGAIHASRLTSANRPPVDNPAATPTNATAPAPHRPDAWMGYAANGGGL